MITLTLEVYNGIIAHAQKDLPNEACGYLAGKKGIVTHFFELTNIDHSPEHFSFDPAEQFSTVKQARKAGLEIVANYHSHPETPARPSEEDIRLAYDPGIHYLIVSLAERETPVVKAFLIRNGKVVQEEITIQK
jgi:[CysO sulfur-carrier protein]-S-L-cysteine hydrolase